VIVVADFWLLSVALLFSMHQISVRKGTLKADTLKGTFVSIATTAVMFSVISFVFLLQDSFWGYHFSGKFSDFLLLMIVAGLLHFFLARTVFYQCISRLGANVAATLATTRIFFAAILGYLLLGETVGPKLALAAVLVFAGVFVLTFHVVFDVYGIVLGLSTGFLTALASVFAREGMKTFPGVESAVIGTAVGYVSSLLAFYVFFYALRGVFCRPWRALKEVEDREKREEFKKGLENYLPFVAGGTFVGFGHLLRYVALSYCGVCLVETFVSMYPLFTYALSGIFVKKAEVFSLRFFASAALIISGTVVLLSVPVPVKL